MPAHPAPPNPRPPMKPTLILLSLLACTALLPAQETPDGTAIFERARQKYATCKTFSCHGTFQQTSDAPFASTDDRTFLIRFARPGQIRVDWTRSRFMGFGTETESIYTDGGTIYSQATFEKSPKPYDSIHSAIGVDAGISAGISYLIPSLLIGEDGYLSHWTISRGADTTIDGRVCYSVSLETKGFGIYTFDIAKDDSAILRATQVSDAAVVNAQRERAHKENPAWFDDPPGTPKPSLSSRTITDFADVTFDAPLDAAAFNRDK